MLEEIIKEYLDDNLSIPVLLNKPQNKPESYVILHRIDGGENDHISAGTLSVICISNNSLYDAADLAAIVKNLLLKSTKLERISSAKLGGMNGYDAPSERVYEYELIFNFYYYEEA